MFGLIKKIFIGLLTALVSGSNNTKYVSFSDQKYKTQPTLINYILMNTVQNFTTILLRSN